MPRTEELIERKMDRNIPELEMFQTMAGSIFERLPLHFGDTTLKRQVFDDGSRGPIKVSTQENEGSSLTVYRNYVIQDGRLVLDPDYTFEGVEPEPIHLRRRVALHLRVLFSKADHWDRETDFYGNVIDAEALEDSSGE